VPPQRIEVTVAVRTLRGLLAFALLVVLAILAVPFAAIMETVLREAGAPRRERMAQLRSAAGREHVVA
jgi:hypothetical protein